MSSGGGKILSILEAAFGGIFWKCFYMCIPCFCCKHIYIQSQAEICLKWHRLKTKNMFVICLHDIVNGYQIQRPSICLGQWNFKKLYLRFLINKTPKVVQYVSKSREVCQFFFSRLMYFKWKLERNFQRYSLFFVNSKFIWRWCSLIWALI